MKHMKEQIVDAISESVNNLRPARLCFAQNLTGASNSSEVFSGSVGSAVFNDVSASTISDATINGGSVASVVSHKFAA